MTEHQMEPALTLDLSHDLAHARDRVFDAWLNPDMLARFMTPGPGMTVPEVASDAREGGRFRIVMRTPDGTDIPHEGEYRAIQRPEKLAFTWVSPNSVEGSLVTLNFEALSGGGTRVRLNQVRFASEQARDGHIGGWTSILAAMEGAL